MVSELGCSEAVIELILRNLRGVDARKSNSFNNDGRVGSGRKVVLGMIKLLIEAVEIDWN